MELDVSFFLIYCYNFIGGYMSKIKIMSENLSNKIAAGEVVEKCASVVKELVENSIDASASEIKIELIDSGVKSIRIVDNGSGMDEEDAIMCFEPHATSKLLSEDDLFNISTLGFRGEALASIAAVAQVELKTRRPDDDLGTYIQINGSKVEQQEPVACPAGSNFAVKNLFYNVPARKKFLKSLS